MEASILTERYSRSLWQFMYELPVRLSRNVRGDDLLLGIATTRPANGRYSKPSTMIALPTELLRRRGRIF